jgi:hypothetical protein
MSNKKVKALIGVGALSLVLYIFYASLPFLVSLASNVIYLSGFFIVIIAVIIGFYYLVKWIRK